LSLGNLSYRSWHSGGGVSCFSMTGFVISISTGVKVNDHDLGYIKL
jgi:hypothetical protein